MKKFFVVLLLSVLVFSQVFALDSSYFYNEETLKWAVYMQDVFDSITDAEAIMKLSVYLDSIENQKSLDSSLVALQTGYSMLIDYLGTFPDFTVYTQNETVSAKKIVSQYYTLINKSRAHLSINKKMSISQIEKFYYPYKEYVILFAETYAQIEQSLSRLVLINLNRTSN